MSGEGSPGAATGATEGHVFGGRTAEILPGWGSSCGLPRGLLDSREQKESGGPGPSCPLQHLPPVFPLFCMGPSQTGHPHVGTSRPPAGRTSIPGAKKLG